MKKQIISFLSLLPVLVSAQDIMYKTDNTKQEVKVTEINATTIKYRAFDNLNGPLYTISKTDVALIIYENGQHESFKTAPLNSVESIISKKEKRYERVTENKNVVFLNAVEFLNSGVGISYLREFGDGKFDLHIPFATSFKAPEMDNALFDLGSGRGHKITHTQYDIGVGLYFNTRGKSSITHFIGPLIRNAQYSGTTNYWVPSEYGYGTYHEAAFKMNETSLMINNGFLYRITPRFNMMINIAVGQFIKRSYSDNVPETEHFGNGIPNRSLALHAGFHFGYRF